MHKKTKKWLLVILLVAGLIYCFLNAGRYLVQEDKLAPADLIVVLMGSGPDRMLEAVDLYKEGYSRRILMVQNNQPGYKLLKSRQVYIPRDADLAKSVGVQMGIPAAAFIILPGDALSTQDEARQIKKYLAAHSEIDSIIVTSSRFHTRRAALIFARTLNNKPDHAVLIMTHPSRYDTFNAQAWWRSREDIEQVVYEYIKLLAFYTIDC